MRETQEESGILPHQIKVHKDFTETLKYEIVKSRYEKEITMQVSMIIVTLIVFFSCLSKEIFKDSPEFVGRNYFVLFSSLADLLYIY